MWANTDTARQLDLLISVGGGGGMLTPTKQYHVIVNSQQKILL